MHLIGRLPIIQVPRQGRVPGTTDVVYERPIEVPELPTDASVTDTTVTIGTVIGDRYQLTDSDGNVIPGPDGQAWVEGTGGEITWSGLSPDTGYHITVQTGTGSDALEFGPIDVVTDVLPPVTGTVTEDGFFLNVKTQPDKEYSVVTPDGETIFGWTAGGDSGELTFGPLPAGTEFVVLERDIGSFGAGEPVKGTGAMTVPDAGREDPEFGVINTTVSVATEEDVIYTLVDGDGNIVPGPGGADRVVGTGGTVTWTGLNPEKDYFLVVERVSGGMTLVSEPIQVKWASHGLSCWTFAAMLALFVAFVWFVLIANGGAMLGGRALLLVIADAAIVALGDGCGWCITVFLVTLAAVAAAVARTLRGSS